MCPGCRENTEGEYSGLEHEVIPGVVESLKVGLTLRLCWACTLRCACLAVALSRTKATAPGCPQNRLHRSLAGWDLYVLLCVIKLDCAVPQLGAGKAQDRL